MDYHSTQQSNARSKPPSESAPFASERPSRVDTSLLGETALAMIVTVLAIKLFGTSSSIGAGWFVTPGILIVAASIPTVVRRRKFPSFGLNIRQMKDSLVVLGRTCVVFLPLTFCSLWLLRSLGYELPLRPVLSQGQGWVYWLLYQFMYISLAEEVFFRGYVLGNILSLMNPVIDKMPRLKQWISIVISAACFAVAHIIVRGQMISALTFLPGLVLGWLFIRTRSLLAPVLFHGLANACYLIMTAMLA